MNRAVQEVLFFWQHFPSCTLQVTGCKGIAEREQPATFNLQPSTARQSLQLWLRLRRAKSICGFHLHRSDQALSIRGLNFFPPQRDG
jgi:hypothetical protein